MLENGSHFFEGVEKLLEIWFEESSNGDDDLRNISRWVPQQVRNPNIRHVLCAQVHAQLRAKVYVHMRHSFSSWKEMKCISTLIILF